MRGSAYVYSQEFHFSPEVPQTRHLPAVPYLPSLPTPPHIHFLPGAQEVHRTRCSPALLQGLVVRGSLRPQEALLLLYSCICSPPYNCRNSEIKENKGKYYLIFFLGQLVVCWTVSSLEVIKLD